MSSSLAGGRTPWLFWNGDRELHHPGDRMLLEIANWQTTWPACLGLWGTKHYCRFHSFPGSGFSQRHLPQRLPTSWLLVDVSQLVSRNVASLQFFFVVLSCWNHYGWQFASRQWTALCSRIPALCWRISVQRQDAEHDGGESTKVCELQNAKLVPFSWDICVRYCLLSPHQCSSAPSVAYDLTWWVIAEWQFRSVVDDEVSASSFCRSCFFWMPRTPFLCVSVKLYTSVT